MCSALQTHSLFDFDVKSYFTGGRQNNGATDEASERLAV